MGAELFQYRQKGKHTCRC